MEIVFNKLVYKEKIGSNQVVHFNDVSLIINSGSIVSFCGDVSKTLGELLMVIKRPTKGEIRLDDLIIQRTSHIDKVNLLRKKIGIVSNDYVFVKKTVKEEIKNVIKNYSYRTVNVSQHILDSMRFVGLGEEYLSRDPNSLSFTEKKKLNLALVLAYNPEVIVLDRFDIGLINRECEYFKKLFLKLKNKLNKTIILLNPRVEFMFSLVDKAYVINKGKLVYSSDSNIFYDDKFYKYVEMPKIVEFTNYANSLEHNILEYTDLKELIKELYRDVK